MIHSPLDVNLLIALHGRLVSFDLRIPLSAVWGATADHLVAL